jgi:hypothetical protein
MPNAPHDMVLRLRAMADPSIRRGFLARELTGIDPEPLAMLLGYLVLNAAHEDVRVAWLDVVVTLLAIDAPPVGAEGAVAVVQRLAGHPGRGVIEFLVTPPDDRRGPTVVGDPYVLEDVALGLRKAKARQRARDQLRQITADPDPSVIRILLTNPLVAETETIRIASRRPQIAATFQVILESPRFGVRESVQSAMVQNPWCPVRVALAVLPLLSMQHLVEVAQSPSLDERVRGAAAALPGIRRRG